MKCEWCNKDTSERFCSIDCKQSYERFEKYANKYAPIFYIGCFGPVFLIFGAIITGNVALWVGLILLIEGINFTLFPFGTPETNEALGVKKTVILVRASAIIFVIAGTALSLSGI